MITAHTTSIPPMIVLFMASSFVDLLMIPGYALGVKEL
jgi:hypothetical protein